MPSENQQSAPSPAKELQEILDQQDMKSIDQLHQVVGQFSTNCFEAKKLSATVLVSAFVFFVTFSKRLDASVLMPSRILCKGTVVKELL